jgi:phosphoribosylformylglycinamidine cyclo-ligase
LKNAYNVKAISHITGGGLTENIPRIIPSSVSVVIDRSSWELPPLMRLFQQLGDIDDQEMFRVFNCGIGLVLIVPTEQADAVCENVRSQGDEAWIIGTIEKRAESPITIK